MQHPGFIWYELMTTDLDAASRFYSTVVGWKSEDFPGATDFRYVILTAGGEGVAGIMDLPQEAAASGMPPSWIGYIYTPDTDAATQSVRDAGGTVYREPADIPGVGRFSVVADPQGAAFMLMTPSGEDREPLRPDAPGNVGWRELLTTDLDAALDFYGKQFGWTKDAAFYMGPVGVYQLYAVGGQQNGGMMRKPAEVPAPGWNFYFNVDALDAALDRVKANGGQVTMEAMEVPGDAWVASCLDPQGAAFSITSTKR